MYINTYDSFLMTLANGQFHWPTENIIVALMIPSHIPSPLHETWADISADHCTGSEYTAHIASNKTLFADTETRKVFLRMDNPFWDGPEVATASAVVYRSMSTAALSNLICYIDFEGTIGPSGMFMEIQLPDDGLLSLSVYG